MRIVFAVNQDLPSAGVSPGNQIPRAVPLLTVSFVIESTGAKDAKTGKALFGYRCATCAQVVGCTIQPDIVDRLLYPPDALMDVMQKHADSHGPKPQTGPTTVDGIFDEVITTKPFEDSGTVDSEPENQ